jgi:hypothetical protein
MSELDNAMRKHINYLIFEEHRPFSFYDLSIFRVGEKEYSMSHGTFRNKVSKMIKAGEIEPAYYSPQGFYTLKGVQYAKPMTGNHTGVLSSSPLFQQQQPHLKNDPVYRLIQNLPLGNRALHDIHLRFEVKGIWSLISTSNAALQQPDPVSKDIRQSTWKIEDLNITATIHSTDTVSIIVGCSFAPVAVDINGIIRLSSALAVVEERLSNLLDECAQASGDDGYSRLAIPTYKGWTVTMWHFGADALITYSGEKFFTSWEVGQSALITTYSKDMKDGKTRIRLERQEYPKKSVAEALGEKLDAIGEGHSNNESRA